MKKWAANLTTLCALFALIVSSGVAKPGRVLGQNNVVTTDVQIPVGHKVALPCVKKEVQLAGEIKAQFRSATDGSYLEADLSYEGVSGRILPDGSEYKGAGTSLFDYSGLSPQEFTYVGAFVLNRPKSYESLMARVKLRIAVNRKGEVTAALREVEVDCGT